MVACVYGELKVQLCKFTKKSIYNTLLRQFFNDASHRYADKI